MTGAEAGPIRVRVCVGTNCVFHGGQAMADRLESEPLLSGLVEGEEVACIGKRCAGGNRAPVVEIDGEILLRASAERVSALLHERLAARRGGALLPPPFGQVAFFR